MNGLSRTFYAAAEAVLRWLSRVCIWPSVGLGKAADWCRERAVAPATPSTDSRV